VTCKIVILNLDDVFVNISSPHANPFPSTTPGMI
jgi:hypothetical protein